MESYEPQRQEQINCTRHHVCLLHIDNPYLESIHRRLNVEAFIKVTTSWLKSLTAAHKPLYRQQDASISTVTTQIRFGDEVYKKYTQMWWFLFYYISGFYDSSL
jgi:hypothetical protein